VYKLGNLDLSKSEAMFKRLYADGTVPGTTPFFRAEDTEVTTKADVYSAALTFAELALKHVKVCEPLDGARDWAALGWAIVCPPGKVGTGHGVPCNESASACAALHGAHRGACECVSRVRVAAFCVGRCGAS
jgi:hypothetical protein